MPNSLLMGPIRVRVSALLCAGVLAALLPVAHGAGSEAGPWLCHPSDYPMARARPGPFSVGPTEVTTVPSDVDGEAIEIGVVRPDVPAGQEVPVIVVATPYLNHSLTADSVAACAPRLVDNFVPHGYAVGLVSIRGTSGSGGCSDLMGPLERADLDQAVTWLGTRDWSNGNVGMIGLSYDGGTAWEVASMGNPHLKTIVPMSGVNDWFDLFYRHGMPEYRSTGVLNLLYYAYPFFPGDVASRSPRQNATAAICPEVARGLAAAMQSAATGERDVTAFWAERNSRPGVEANYRGSILLARGLQDWNVDPAHDFPWVTELESKGIYVKYVLGQWGHHFPDSSSEDEVRDPGEPVRWDWADLLLDWWDRWLKDDRSVKLGPRAQVQDSSGAWRYEQSWPPRDARTTKLYLTADNNLATVPSDAPRAFPIAFDPYKHLSDGRSRSCVCARFTWRPPGGDIRLAGVPVLEATVTPLGPGGHLSAFLYSDDDLIGWGAVDLRFAHGGASAQTVVPGTTMPVRLPLEPLDAVLPASRALTLLVAQSGYSGNGSVGLRNSAMVFPLQLEVGGEASKFVVRTFTRGPRPFFEPPLRARPPA